jgi:hypothetical protein
MVAILQVNSAGTFEQFLMMVVVAFIGDLAGLLLDSFKFKCISFKYSLNSVKSMTFN